MPGKAFPAHLSHIAWRHDSVSRSAATHSATVAEGSMGLCVSVRCFVSVLDDDEALVRQCFLHVAFLNLHVLAIVFLWLFGGAVCLLGGQRGGCLFVPYLQQRGCVPCVLQRVRDDQAPRIVRRSEMLSSLKGRRSSFTNAAAGLLLVLGLFQLEGVAMRQHQLARLAHASAAAFRAM